MTQTTQNPAYKSAAKRLFFVTAQAAVIGGMVAAFTTPNLDPVEAREQALTRFNAADSIHQVDVDRIVRARVDFGSEPAFLEQVHLSRDGQPVAITFRVGAGNEFSATFGDVQRATLPADAVRYSRTEGDLVVNPDAIPAANSPETLPALQPQPITNIAAARLIGADVVTEDDRRIGHLAGINYDSDGNAVSVRLVEEDWWGYARPETMRTVSADCVRFIALTRTVQAGPCDASRTI
ncbi:hypothetical protein [Maricaulis sp. CAU 1757]